MIDAIRRLRFVDFQMQNRIPVMFDATLGSMKRRQFIFSAAVAGFLSGCGTLPRLGKLTT
jgi:hypothetical protein